MKIRLFGTVNDSIVDGPGLRYAIFVQGCYHHCLGCHNPKSHDIYGGFEKDVDEILEDIDQNPLLDGVTFSGGEPFLQIQPLIYLAREIKKRGLNIVIYSGFQYEELIVKEEAKELLSLCDMLVDGKFILEKKSLALLYRGSSNQRLIDLKQTLKNKQIVEYEIDEYGQIDIA